MKFDLHFHTSRYSACAVSTPDEMIRRAIRAGLDGVAITEHDVLWPKEALRDLREKYPVITILSGVELSVDDSHILLFGAEDVPETTWGKGAVRRTLEEVDPEKVFRVIAHPFRYDLSDEKFEYLLRLPFDGVETASCHTFEEAGRRALQLAEAANLVKVAGSDSHSVDMVGGCYTVFEDPIRTTAELVAALREGRCRPGIGEAMGDSSSLPA